MKRFLTNLILIISILSILVIPSFAATISDSNFAILKQPTDTFFKFNGQVYVASFSIVAIGVNSYQWQISYDDGVSWYSFPSDLAKTPNFRDSYSPGPFLVDRLYRCMLTTDEGVFYSRVVMAEAEPTNIFNFVSSCLRYITSYISLIVNSLVTPGAPLYALPPVLCIGIAVAALLIVIKIIKGFSWGT